MTKKIKDLTAEEIAKICKGHTCYTCPLKIDLVGSKLSDVFVCAGKIANKLDNEVTMYEFD